MNLLRNVVSGLLLGLLCVPVWAASNGHIQLDKAPVNLHDRASLQRGAKLYMNYCSGCHGLDYMRYSRVSEDLAIPTELFKQHLMFDKTASLSDTLHLAMPRADTQRWFGVVPPDFTLIAREKGADWIYTYLRSFYQDSKRPLGTNNRVYPDVAMPNVLLGLQGPQRPVWKAHTFTYADHQTTVNIVERTAPLAPGRLSAAEFDQAVADLVNFLVYVGEPVTLERRRIGLWVLAFLGVLAALSYLLKQEFWKDIPSSRKK